MVCDINSYLIRRRRFDGASNGIDEGASVVVTMKTGRMLDSSRESWAMFGLTACIESQATG